MLHNWIKKYKENDYNIVERKRGRSTTIMAKNNIKPKSKETIEEENERLKKENLYLKAELEYQKKIESCCSSKEQSTTEEKVNDVSELRLKYPIKILLQISGVARSVFYYNLSNTDKDDKNKEIINKIKEIFINNKERYGIVELHWNLKIKVIMLIIKRYIK